MKSKCPKCGIGKARRNCPREGNVQICSECCASIRDSDCGDCIHYASVLQYENRRTSTLPEGHFIMEINPEVQSAVNTALEFLQKGLTQKAMTLLTGLLDNHPRNHDVTFGIGVVHAFQEKHEKAIAWFDKAIAIYPYSVESHYNKAVAYQKMLDLPNCIRAYQKVVAIGDPADDEVGQARSFIASISAAIWKNERLTLEVYLDSSDLFNQAFESMERSEWQAALDGFHASAALNQRNAPCQGNMGLCYMYLGRKAEALAAFDRALEIDPGYQPARSNRIIVEKLEEGVPMSDIASKTVNYGMEKFEEERQGR